MNLTETNHLLTVVANIDNRRVDDATVVAWQELLSDLPLADCLTAVRSHFRESAEYLVPAHIVAGARQAHRDRVRAANEARALEAAVAHDQAPRGPSVDRTAEIRDFVASIRDGFNTRPNSSDLLRHGARHWRENREALDRERHAQPNPHYDPGALARLAETYGDGKELKTP